MFSIPSLTDVYNRVRKCDVLLLGVFVSIVSIYQSSLGEIHGIVNVLFMFVFLIGLYLGVYRSTFFILYYFVDVYISNDVGILGYIFIIIGFFVTLFILTSPAVRKSYK